MNFIKGIYNNLKGRSYGSLSIDHKCIVYAYKLWKNGLDLEVASELLIDDSLTESFIDDYLEKTFKSDKDTIIGI